MEFAMADNTGPTIGYKKTDNGIIPVREDSSGSEIEYLKKAARLQSGIIFLSTSNRSYKKEIMQHLVVLYCQNLFELIARPQALNWTPYLPHTFRVRGSNAERIVLAKKLPLKDKLFPEKIISKS